MNDFCYSCNEEIEGNDPIHFDVELEGRLFKQTCQKCYNDIVNARKINELDEKSKEITSGKKTLMRMNKGKTQWTLLGKEGFDFIEQMVKVLEFGMKKGYPKDNWKLPVKDIGDVDNSKLRHCIADAKGEYIDTESNIPHCVLEAVNCMFKFHQVKNNGFISIKV